jgi:hypothetical protein
MVTGRLPLRLWRLREMVVRLLALPNLYDPEIGASLTP